MRETGNLHFSPLILITLLTPTLFSSSTLQAKSLRPTESRYENWLHLKKASLLARIPANSNSNGAPSAQWPACLTQITSDFRPSSLWSTERAFAVSRKLAAKGLTYGAPAFLRSFKKMKAEETDGMGVLELWLEGESGNYILFSRYSLCGSSKNLPMGFYSFGPDQLKSAKGGYDPPGGTPTLGSDCGKLNELSVSESDFDEIQLILFTALNSNCIRKSDKSESVYSVPYHSFPFPLNVANLETMKSDSRLDESSRAKFREMTEGYSAFEKVASPPSFALVGSGEKALYKQEKRGPRVERRICP